MKPGAFSFPDESQDGDLFGPSIFFKTLAHSCAVAPVVKTSSMMITFLLAMKEACFFLI
jgi:hypothetical protein